METSAGCKTYSTPRLGWNAWRLSLDRVRGLGDLQKAGDKRGILATGPAFDARGDIDDGGAGDPDRLGNVVRRQPPRKHVGHPVLDAGQQPPRKCRTVPPWPGRAGRCLGVEQ